MISAEQRLSYEQAEATRWESSLCLMAAFRVVGVPHTMIDIGCGPGHTVALATALGVQAQGVDVLPPSDEVGLTGDFTQHDLTHPSMPSHRAELVL